MKKLCPMCSGKLVVKKINFSLYGENLGKFKADVCNKCGEKFFDEETSKKIDAVAKKKGLYGLEASTKVSRVGNNIAVRINKKIAEFLHLKKGEEVRIYPENKEKIIVEIQR